MVFTVHDLPSWYTEPSPTGDWFCVVIDWWWNYQLISPTIDAVYGGYFDGSSKTLLLFPFRITTLYHKRCGIGGVHYSKRYNGKPFCNLYVKVQFISWKLKLRYLILFLMYCMELYLGTEYIFFGWNDCLPFRYRTHTTKMKMCTAITYVIMLRCYYALYYVTANLWYKQRKIYYYFRASFKSCFYKKTFHPPFIILFYCYM